MTAVRVINIKQDPADDFGAAFLRLAERVSSVVCFDHHTSASLMTVFRNKAGISGCCDGLLDRVERALEEP
jgi:hypothetical protein